MSLALSHDNRWIYFDLLGHLYRVPLGGGTAVCLTQDSGIALNFHPAVSPDDQSVAFISDRGGQDGLWIMGADGTGPRLVFMDRKSRISTPTWLPDGKSVVAIRSFPTPGRGWHRTNARLWEFPLDGRAPHELYGSQAMQVGSPRAAPSGRAIFFHVSYPTANRYGTQAGYQIFRLELPTGKLRKISDPEHPAPAPEAFQVQDLSQFPKLIPAELAPVPSPDGRWLAYAREQPARALHYRGHSLAPSTELWIRSLEGKAEHEVYGDGLKDLSRAHAMYSYRVLPSYDWTSDGANLVFSAQGHLWRVDVHSRRTTLIPFEAPVRRVISERTRSHLSIRDDVFDAKFLQWPASTRDGKRLAFVSAGRIWWMDLPSGTPRRLTSANDGAIELTPTWSADGRSIIFASWSPDTRGALWLGAIDGGVPRRLTEEPGEYLYPEASPDGARIIVSRHRGAPRSNDDWNPWNARNWEIVELRTETGTIRARSEVESPRRSVILDDGSVAYYIQRNAPAARGLWSPFPSQEALATNVVLMLASAEGSRAARELLELPPEYEQGYRPQLSPSGEWVAFEADRQIYVQKLNATARARQEPQRIETDPNVSVPQRLRVSRRGGTFARWSSASVLEFMSGDRHITYDARTGLTAEHPIHLQHARHIGHGRLAITNARLITLDAAGTIERGTIVVEDARIRCVGACELSGVSRTIDGTHLTVMPGLVDVHAHHLSEATDVVPLQRPASALALAYGVTTIIDPAVSSSTAFPIAELIESGRLAGPRTFTTSETVVSPAYGFGQRRDIETFEDALDQVARRVGWGAVSIKNFRQARRDQSQKLIAAARYYGVTVTGEGGPPYFDLAFVMDGQTGWEHTMMAIPLYSDMARFLGAAGAVYSPTAIVSGHPKGAAEYFRPRERALSSARYRRFAPERYIASTSAYARVTPLEEFSFPLIAEGAKDVLRAGGHITIGEHGEQYGIGSHWEIWAYGTAMTPEEALQTATLSGAWFIGLDQEIGSLRPGKIADLLILRGNPLQDLHETANIEAVMKAGVLYDGDTLDEVWPEQIPYGTPPWQPAAARPNSQ